MFHFRDNLDDQCKPFPNKNILFVPEKVSLEASQHAPYTIFALSFSWPRIILGTALG